MTDTPKNLGRLHMLDDGLPEDTREAFARVFELENVSLPTWAILAPLHQELRLAIEVWHDAHIAGVDWPIPLGELVGRDKLALVHEAAVTRIVRVVSTGGRAV